MAAPVEAGGRRISMQDIKNYTPYQAALMLLSEKEASSKGTVVNSFKEAVALRKARNENGQNDKPGRRGS